MTVASAIAGVTAKDASPPPNHAAHSPHGEHAGGHHGQKLDKRCGAGVIQVQSGHGRAIMVILIESAFVVQLAAKPGLCDGAGNVSCALMKIGFHVKPSLILKNER